MHRKVIRSRTKERRDELTIEIGDLVNVIRELPKSNGQWLFVININTKEQGYVPTICLDTRLVNPEEVLNTSTTRPVTFQPEPSESHQPQSVRISSLPLPPSPPVVPPIASLPTTHHHSNEASVATSSAVQEYFQNQSWYFGPITRDAAERRLKDPKVPLGTFIARYSGRTEHYVLSVKKESVGKDCEISHIIIKISPEGKVSLHPTEEFDTISAMLQHYINNPECRDRHGLLNPLGMQSNATQVVQQIVETPAPTEKAEPRFEVGSSSNNEATTYNSSCMSSSGESAVYTNSEGVQVKKSSKNKLKKIRQIMNKIKPSRSEATKCTDNDDEFENLEVRVDEWNLDYGNLQFIKELGKGFYGEVKLMKLKISNELVAVKSFKDNMDLLSIKKELEAMKHLRHPNLVNLIAVCTHENCISLVMEYHSNGSLDQFLKRGHGKDMKTDDLIAIATGVVEGMAYLEEAKFIHRDLAARNVLISDDFTPKVSDLGLARTIKNKSKEVDSQEVYEPNSTKLPIPVPWTAPEALVQDPQWTSKSDVWSFGVLEWELFTKCSQVPYAVQLKKINKDNLLLFLQGNKRLEAPISCPPYIYQQMMWCWNIDLEERPSFAQLKVWFNN